MKPIVTSFIILLIVDLVAGNDSDFKPNENPVLNIPFVTHPIVVDGDLGDKGWQNAAIAENFTEFTPTEGNEPALDTKALVTYDDEFIYIAFICQDDPDFVGMNIQFLSGHLLHNHGKTLSQFHFSG